MLSTILRTWGKLPLRLSCFSYLTEQILVAFTLSSILTLLVLTFTLWLQHLKHVGQENLVTKYLKQYLSHKANPIRFWIRQSEIFILALSDQQLLTGLLLLACAYSK
jgi:hypothetical protein